MHVGGHSRLSPVDLLMGVQEWELPDVEQIWISRWSKRDPSESEYQVMKLVIQRVRRGSVSVDGRKVAGIQRGLVILVGVGSDDTREDAEWLAEKCAYLRIFEDIEGKTNLSIKDVEGEALVVSQFTLYADTRKGRRPSFIHAALPEVAEPLVNVFAESLKTFGIPVQMGVFGAHMLVEIENDGPVTILLERGDS